MLPVAAVVVAVVLMVVPVDAQYLNEVGSDTAVFLTASCGSPAAALLGADPGLGGGSEYPIGGEASRTACTAAAGKRVVPAMAVLLIVSVIGWNRALRKARIRASVDVGSGSTG